MKSRVGLMLVGLLAACAQMGAPPGGPEDRQPPRVLATRPDSMARLTSFPGPVVIVFDEGLSEDGLEDAVDVSPRTSAVAVEKRGDELRVDLRRGWQRDRIYQVTIEPTIQDRFHNKIPAPVRVVFSTGPEIPATRFSGHVEERQTGNNAVRMRVEAVAADSVVYSARTDSAGVFVFEHLPAGSYRVRAYNDPNRNREMEPFEARDTTGVTVAAGTEPVLQLSVVTPDSTAPRMTSASVEDGVVVAKFDDYLLPTQPLDQVRVQLLGPDSVAVAVAEYQVGALTPPDSAARDTARRDTARGRAPARRDTAARDSARPARRLPAQTVAIRPARPLTSDVTYRVIVSGVRNLVGLSGGGTAQFRTPRAPAPVAAPAQPPAGPVQSAPPPASPPTPAPARPPR